ncbi:O-antigen ligase family protein [Patescibacteria group bacterium]|nr:O-antigen ligase family protein [Patescibacteria group bacterium]MBU1015691.1 O-antigen ligase family protein [Patescibacteria group bacterium]MBU1685369.1 O-antigen ligase family protein [Patescibacteria group bacterium]MBU1938403.1 O-antigen ligase family protein [Patescibacteria group bacterium]
MKKLLYALFVLLLLAPVTGELWHIPIWRFEFLPSDIIILVLFPLWIIDKLVEDRRVRIGKIGRMIALFLFVMVTTYFLNMLRFDFQQMLSGFILMGRFGMYVIVAGIAFDLLDRDKTGFLRKLLIGAMILSMVLIIVLGFLQLKFFPSFLDLGLYLEGWDPHEGRLLSTWFDPNFIGGYLAFVLPVALALGLYFKRHKHVRWAVAMFAVSVIGLVALYLTFSRSGYLALIASLGILTFFKSRKLLLALVIVAVIGFSLSSRVQERTIEAVDSAKGLIGLDSQKPLDATAELRVYSWQFAREIIADHPLLGVGFGRYAFEINERGHGLLSDHSSGGSDSSLLTIWAQTGVFGLLSYLAIGFVAAITAIRRIRKKDDFDSYLLLGLLSGFSGMMIHSVFVNSLLYALMMVYLWTGLALMDKRGC